MNNDAILSGKVALIVYGKVPEKLDNVSFCESALKVLEEFDDGDLVKPIRDHIYEDAKNKYSDKEQAWNLVARRPMRRRTNPNQKRNSRPSKCLKRQLIQ